MSNDTYYIAWLLLLGYVVVLCEEQ